MKGKKTGGRVKGTPNKDNPLKGFIRAHSVKYFTEIVKEGLTQFEIDQMNLAVDDRVNAELRLLEFHQAKLKAVDANINTHNVSLTIEDKLRELCKEEEDGE